ncbi:BolA family transcriptional regulator [Psychromarinibacter sp. C21-152]|uniref:BolA family transcriptional regulator n=1 Tax=Psychromarinibacter sediminicola TaxID=3033385 RepID=A0AAE3T917_9RHOB|nr:BolA family protein [Psychromarinibacter sediminicola]MDF0600115.1 BolA family transcriptional regulator [Psychromarinibacter sediminicola]
MSLTETIEQRLRDSFAPDTLSVEDESEKHRGHAGYREGGESHFRVHISAPAFASMSRLERHRAVHAALGAEVMDRVHALALHIEGGASQ